MTRAHVVVCGPSGVGKTTVATAVARTLGADFIEADTLHPDANVQKMSKGIPLDDEDRGPWLRRVRDAIASADRADRPSVVACSALTRRYRDQLTPSGTRVFFVQLITTSELIATRMRAREGHFMPVSLLSSQLSTFEPLASDEPGIVVDVTDDVAHVESEVLEGLRTAGIAP